MPEKDPSNLTALQWALSIAAMLIGALWAILTKRVFDLPKEYVMKNDNARVIERLEKSIKEVEAKVTAEVRHQAEQTLAEIHRIYDAIEKRHNARD